MISCAEGTCISRFNALYFWHWAWINGARGLRLRAPVGARAHQIFHPLLCFVIFYQDQALICSLLQLGMDYRRLYVWRCCTRAWRRPQIADCRPPWAHRSALAAGCCPLRSAKTLWRHATLFPNARMPAAAHRVQQKPKPSLHQQNNTTAIDDASC